MLKTKVNRVNFGWERKGKIKDSYDLDLGLGQDLPEDWSGCRLSAHLHSSAKRPEPTTYPCWVSSSVLLNGISTALCGKVAPQPRCFQELTLGTQCVGTANPSTPSLYFRSTFFLWGKEKHSLQGARTNLHHGGEKHTRQRHQSPTDLQCKAMHCKHSAGLETQHAATTQHRRAPEHLKLSEPGCPVVNTAFGGFCKPNPPQREEESLHHIPSRLGCTGISALTLLTHLSDADSSGGEPSAECFSLPSATLQHTSCKCHLHQDKGALCNTDLSARSHMEFDHLGLIGAEL